MKTRPGEPETLPGAEADARLAGMKKILLGLAVVVVVAIGGAAVFVAVAGRDAPPPDDGEFVVEQVEIAPADNAFTYFLDATNLLVETTNRQLVAEFLAGQTADDGQLRELVERNAACLAQVKRGTECAVCWMPTVLAFDTEFPYLTTWLDIGRVLAIQARQARLAGRTDAAAEAALGGALGTITRRSAIRWGIARGVFSNEAGLGSAAMTAA